MCRYEIRTCIRSSHKLNHLYSEKTAELAGASDSVWAINELMITGGGWFWAINELVTTGDGWFGFEKNEKLTAKSPALISTKSAFTTHILTNLLVPTPNWLAQILEQYSVRSNTGKKQNNNYKKTNKNKKQKNAKLLAVRVSSGPYNFETVNLPHPCRPTHRVCSETMCLLKLKPTTVFSFVK